MCPINKAGSCCVPRRRRSKTRVIIASAPLFPRNGSPESLASFLVGCEDSRSLGCMATFVGDFSFADRIPLLPHTEASPSGYRTSFWLPKSALSSIVTSQDGNCH
ncbi:hypothetical protein SUGI_0301520 [Cryptomeria japonica]|nr:hypothetical protein SUGI_0301520 [Cryptomeria japonica]